MVATEAQRAVRRLSPRLSPKRRRDRICQISRPLYAPHSSDVACERPARNLPAWLIRVVQSSMVERVEDLHFWPCVTTIAQKRIPTRPINGETQQKSAQSHQAQSGNPTAIRRCQVGLRRRPQSPCSIQLPKHRLDCPADAQQFGPEETCLGVSSHIEGARVRAIIAALVVTSAFCISFTAPAKADNEVVRGEPCGDLLADLKQESSHLDFLGCQEEMREPVRAQVARYRVAGSQAQAVERHFMKTANMPALVFLCCGWDSVGPKGRDGWLQAGVEHFTISMHSDETLFNRRADWSRIPWFNVTVIRYLEMP